MCQRKNEKIDLDLIRMRLAFPILVKQKASSSRKKLRKF
jgi:hypothetical protein